MSALLQLPGFPEQVSVDLVIVTSGFFLCVCESFDVNMRYYTLGEYSTCQSHIYAEDFWRYMCLYPTLPLATYTYTSIQLAVLSQIFPLSYTCASESGNN